MRQIALLTLANVVYALAQWGVVVLIARIGGVEAQGHYSYVLALTTPIVLCARMNLRAVLATDHTDSFQFADYFAARLLWSAVALVCSLAVAVVADAGALLGLVLGVSCMKFVEGLGELTHGRLQRDQRGVDILVGLVARAFIALAVFGAMLDQSMKLGYAALATASIWAICVYCCEWRALAAYHRTADAKHYERVWSLSKKCWTIGMSMALISAFTYAPVYFLQLHADAIDIARYAAVSYLWMIGVFFATNVVQAVAPHLARAFHDEPARYLHLLWRAAGFAVAGGALLVGMSVAWGEQLVVFIYGTEYAGLGDAIDLMVAGILVSAMQAVLGMNMTITREFVRMLLGNLGALACIIALCAWLVPKHGVYGAALALLVALSAKLIVSMVQTILVLRRRLGAHSN